MSLLDLGLIIVVFTTPVWSFYEVKAFIDWQDSRKKVVKVTRHKDGSLKQLVIT